MNISALTAKEVLRMCEPVTELEKRLFDMCSELQNDIDDAIHDRDVALNDLDCYECDSCEDKISDIERAVGLIKSGKVDDGVQILERIS